MQFCAHALASGQAVAFGLLPQSPQLKLLVAWWTGCESASSTRKLVTSLQPPALVHRDVTSLGCTSGPEPGFCADATPARRAVVAAARQPARETLVGAIFPLCVLILKRDWSRGREMWCQL